MEAHTALGMIRMFSIGTGTGAETSFRPCHRDQSWPRSGASLVFALSVHSGSTSRGLAQIRKAQELDPLSIIINQNAGRAYHRRAATRTRSNSFSGPLRSNPGYFTTYVCWRKPTAPLERDTGGDGDLRTAEEIAGPEAADPGGTGVGAEPAGRKGEARRLLGELIGLPEREHVPLYQLALAHLSLGEETTAFDLAGSERTSSTRP